MRAATNHELRQAGMAALDAGDHLTLAALNLIAMLPVEDAPDCERPDAPLIDSESKAGSPGILGATRTDRGL